MKKITFIGGCLFLAALTGCMKIHEDFVIMPDGSGKLTFTLAINLKMDDDPTPPDKEKDPVDDFMSEDPDKLENQFAGIVAISKPTAEKKGDWQYITFTMYFEDINKVQLRDADALKDKDTPKQTFTFKKQETGFVLEMQDGLLSSGKDETAKEQDLPEEMKKEVEAMFQKMIKGFEIKQTVRMPGQIASIDNFTEKDGRNATFKLDESSLKKSEDMKKYEKKTTRKIVCGTNEISETDQAAFRKELEKAKSDWAELKKTMKKNSEEKNKKDK